VKNNIYAIYLGCAGILIGGAGLAYDRSGGDDRPQQEALFVQAGLTPSPAAGPNTWNETAWPPPQSAVAFHDEMVALLTPQTTQGTAARPLEPQQAAPAREVIREPAPDRRQRTRTSRRRQAPDQTGRQAPDQTVGVAHDDDNVVNGRATNRRDSRRGRERDEVEVIGRDGRTYRIERGDDDDAPPPAARRYRGERRGVTPDPFRLFGDSW
jgi:hypothetical protein